MSNSDLTIPIKTKLIVFTVNIVINLFVAFPIALHSYFRFVALTKNKKMQIVHKRYPSAVKIQCFLCFFILTIERNIIAFLNGHFTEFVDAKHIYILWRVARCIYPAISVCIWFGLYRFWHICYELQLTKFLSESTWKRYLNSDVLKTNWYVTNKAKYGLTKYTKRTMLVTVCLVTVIRIGIYQLFELNDHKKTAQIERAVDILLYLLPFTFIGVIAYKAPAVHDKFYIKQEMTYYCAFLYSSLALYIISMIVQRTNIVQKYWVQFFLSYLGAWSVLSLCLIQTLWVKYKIEHDPAYLVHQASYNLMKLKNKSTNSLGQNHSAHPPMTMKQYIAQQKGFELFAEHLQQEFSLELILFFIEVMQFKALVKSKCNLQDTSKNVRVQHVHGGDSPTQSTTQIASFQIDSEFECDDYKLTDYESIICNLSVPKSQIVHQLFDEKKPNHIPTESFQAMFASNSGIPDWSSLDSMPNTMKFKTVSILLYMRYIQRGSELEINIPSSCREALDQQLCDINHTECDTQGLYHIFDEAIVEICSLLLFSFDRFKVEHTMK